MKILTARFLSWGVASLYLLVLIVVHVIPTGSVDISVGDGAGGLRLSDIAHLVVFAPWGMLLVGGYLIARKRGILRATGIGVIGLGVIVGIESLHLIIPHRTFNPNDMLFNFSGTLIGAAALITARAVRSGGRGAVFNQK